MDRTTNPFHDLWLTEILNPEEFVQLFSPEVVKLSDDLFGKSNVVVRGRSGSGKSMLLRLLDSNTKIAYAKSVERSPIPDNSRYITGKIDLLRSGFSAITNRLPRNPNTENKHWAAAIFSDFLNYSLALNLMEDIYKLHQNQLQDNGQQILALNMKQSNVKGFVKFLSYADSWNGFLWDCKTWNEIEKKMDERLVAYKNFFNYNAQSLPDDIETSRTEVGIPLAELVELLRYQKIIPNDCQVYLKIDQLEELYQIEKESGYGDVFRQVINRALAQRDQRIAYRIGTRHYAWSAHTKVWGTNAHIEEMRDYSVIDIDEKFRNREHSERRFSKFAEDVFKRRLRVAGFNTNSRPLSDVFGTTASPSDRAKELIKSKTKMSFPSNWAPEWITTLEKLAEEDPLDAKLGEAWLRQEAQQKAMLHLDGRSATSFDWREKQWWCKERKEAALMQIAGERRQNMIWYGKRHIIDLSGYNILAFMSICRTIWSGWLRVHTDDELRTIAKPKIGKEQQIIGIYEASKLWIDKLGEGQEGDKRRLFIIKLGDWFVKKIKKDKSLSYPGHNGFSLLKSEFETDNKISRLIRLCRDYGDLIESEHTSKTSTGSRIKWYLNPILCPYFGLPHVRTKEPIYTTLSRLFKDTGNLQEQVTRDIFE